MMYYSAGVNVKYTRVVSKVSVDFVRLIWSVNFRVDQLTYTSSKLRLLFIILKLVFYVENIMRDTT